MSEEYERKLKLYKEYHERLNSYENNLNKVSNEFKNHTFTRLNLKNKDYDWCSVRNVEQQIENMIKDREFLSYRYDFLEKLKSALEQEEEPEKVVTFGSIIGGVITGVITGVALLGAANVAHEINKKQVYVKGYRKEDGTYVKGYHKRIARTGLASSSVQQNNESNYTPSKEESLIEKYYILLSEIEEKISQNDRELKDARLYISDPKMFIKKDYSQNLGCVTVFLFICGLIVASLYATNPVAAATIGMVGILCFVSVVIPTKMED